VKPKIYPLGKKRANLRLLLLIRIFAETGGRIVCRWLVTLILATMVTSIFVLIFGILSGTLLSVLVGLVGSKRRIGFGWAFLLSLIFTPIVGLIVALISDPLPVGQQRWGCLAPFLVLLVLILLLVAAVVFFGAGAALLAA